jgi:hypothetical protein
LFEFGKLKFSGSRKCRFGAFGKPGKSFGIFDSNLREDPAVQIDTGFFKTADKSAIGDIVETGGGAQAYDEQASEIPFLCAPVPVGELQSAIHGFFCGTMQLAFGQAVSFCQPKDLLPALDSFVTSFYSWHFSTPKCIQ